MYLIERVNDESVGLFITLPFDGGQNSHAIVRLLGFKRYRPGHHREVGNIASDLVVVISRKGRVTVVVGTILILELFHNVLVLLDHLVHNAYITGVAVFRGELAAS